MVKEKRAEKQLSSLIRKLKLNMRSITIYTTLPTVGGNSTITLGLATFFAKHNFKIGIIARIPKNHLVNYKIIKTLEKSGCTVKTIEDTHHNSFFTTLQVIKIARQMGNELFISIGMGYVAPLLAICGGFKRKYFYYINHDPQINSLRRIGIGLKAFDMIIVISPVSLEPIKKFLGSSIKTLWLPQFSQLKFHHKGEEVPKQFNDNKLKFGFIGNLIESKGILDLLTIWSKGMNNCELQVLGDGALKEKVENYSKQYSNITYLGSFSASERDLILPNVFDNLDYLLVPSIGHGEGIPTVILEALSCGVPVIASNGGGTIVFDEPFLHEDFGDSVKLLPASEFSTILSNSVKPSLIVRQQAKNAYQKWFSNAVLSSKWLAITN